MYYGLKTELANDLYKISVLSNNVGEGWADPTRPTRTPIVVTELSIVAKKDQSNNTGIPQCHLLAERQLASSHYFMKCVKITTAMLQSGKKR